MRLSWAAGEAVPFSLSSNVLTVLQVFEVMSGLKNNLSKCVSVGINIERSLLNEYASLVDQVLKEKHLRPNTQSCTLLSFTASAPTPPIGSTITIIFNSYISLERERK